MDVTIKDEVRLVVRNLQMAVAQIRDDTRYINASGDHVAIIRNYDDVRIAVEQIKEAREALAQMAEDLSRETIPDTLRGLGIKTITIEGVGRVSVSARFSASILPEKKPEAYSWLRESGNGSLIVETVNAQTLSSFAKNLLETEGVDLPSDLFKIGSMSYTSITKVK